MAFGYRGKRYKWYYIHQVTCMHTPGVGGVRPGDHDVVRIGSSGFRRN